MAVSDDFKTDAWSPEGDQPLALLTIDHDDLDAPHRLVNDRAGVTSGGEVFTAFNFELQPPSKYGDAPPHAQITIDNVSREIGQSLRSVATPATVTLQIVRRSDPDTIEAEWTGLRLVNVSIDALQVTGDLLFEDLVREPYPGRTFSPAEFPGLVK